MSARARRCRDFLARAGWQGAARTALAGDASARRYERLARGGESAVLMDAPPPREAVAPFVAVARLLRGMGYSAPEIRAVDETRGFVLMEDFGDESFAALLAGAGGATLERTLYEAATDLLLDLRARPVPAALPRYDGRWMLDDAALFLESAAAGGTADAAMAGSFEGAWREPLEAAAAAPAGFCFRDFHAGNLMWLPDRGGVRRVGLLDFQDARIAPFAYDLVSLLQDARRALRPGLAEAMVARYLRGASARDAAAFRAAYAILGAQRSFRIAGVFARLARRDGKRRYLAHLPRVWDNLEMNLAHPALAPVRSWVDTWLPERARGCAP